MRSPYGVSCFPVACTAGDNHIAPVHAYPHILSRHKKRIAVVAEPAAEGTEDPDPLPHRDPAGQLHVPVAHFRVLVEYSFCLLEQYRYPFTSNLFGCRIF